MPRKKIALLRGAKHSSVEMLTYAPLAKDFDIETILSKPHKTDLSEIPEGIVIKEYLSPATTLEKVGFDLQYLVGAEKKLQKYDLVHSFELANMATLQAVKAKKLNPKLKVTATVWENIPFNHEKYKLQRKMKSEAIQFVDHFLAITERAKFALEVEGVDPEKISIVPVGIDTDKFSSQPKDQALMNELGLKESDRVLLTIARAVWEKGVWDLLIGSKEAIKKFPDLKVVVVGKGPLAESYRALAKRLRIEKNVVFVDFVTYANIPKLYNLADIFALLSIPIPTWQEQFGRVLVEAMAARNIVITTLTGSIPEVVQDGALLIPPADPYMFSKTLVSVLNEAIDTSVLKEKARKVAEDNFKFADCSDKIKAIFNKVLHESS